MASTYKVPLAVYVLHLIDKGIFDLDQKIELFEKDLRLDGSLITNRFTLPGVALSIRNLLRLTIEVSENTATDVLFGLCGGPKTVDAFLKQNDILDMRIDHTVLQLLFACYGITHQLSEDDYTLKEFKQVIRQLEASEVRNVREKFFREQQDTTTPQAMIAFLEKFLFRGLISESSSRFLLECMCRCVTGLKRIRAGIPKDIHVAQKTGTANGITNDIGIIKLPNNKGTFLAIFIQTTASLEEQEGLISRIAKFAFDCIYRS